MLAESGGKWSNSPSESGIAKAGLNTGAIFRPRRAVHSAELGDQPMSETSMYRVIASYVAKLPGVVKRQEPIGVQTFVPQSSVEGFDQRLVGRLPWPTEVECSLVEIRPPAESNLPPYRCPAQGVQVTGVPLSYLFVGRATNVVLDSRLMNFYLPGKGLLKILPAALLTCHKEFFVNT